MIYYFKLDSIDYFGYKWKTVESQSSFQFPVGKLNFFKRDRSQKCCSAIQTSVKSFRVIPEFQIIYLVKFLFYVKTINVHVEPKQSL